MDKLAKTINSMSIEDKLKTVHGSSFWLFNSYSKDVNPVSCTDGPNGIRKQKRDGDNLLISQNYVECTTFPTGSTFACSFDKELVNKMAKALAMEFQFYNVNVLLGPAACIKRNPLCGRNFEYLSEDPILSGYIAGNYIKGAESTGTGTSLKHYVANNQEFGRQINSSTMSIKCLRDIYTRGFEIAARIGKPATIMVSYNKINGVYACENSYIMQQVMRKEVGYEGFFISDWTGVSNPLASIKAGLNVEMPERNYGPNFYELAYKEGKIKEDDLNELLRYYIPFIDKYSKTYNIKSIDFEENLKLAVEVAENSIVLAKNEENFFPLSKEESLIVLGNRAKHMAYLGGGSSMTNSHHKPDFIKVLTDNNVNYKFFDCYDKKGNLDLNCLKEINNEKVLVFLGTGDFEESEGFDRKDMKLPPYELKLMEELAKITKNVGVIVESGSVVELPFLDNIKGLFIPYFAGEGEDYALYNLIYGKTNPSGKLAETWIKKYEDCPSSSSYDKDVYNSYYDEDIYVGYRYYDKHNIKVNFPFGHGLSYTKFKLNLLRTAVSKAHIKCEIEVTNLGDTKGKEVIEIYLGKKDSKIYRAPRELVGFSKVEVFPHSKKRVIVTIDNLDLRVYDPSTNKLTLENGNYELYLGDSSRCDFIEEKITLVGENIKPYELVGPDHSLVFKETKDMNILASTVSETPTFKAILKNAGFTEDVLHHSFFKDGFFKNLIRGLSGLGSIDYCDVERLLPQMLKELENSKK